jgi:predicted RNA binding protein YcfA (HicA-like mRNA interferase family)
MAGEARFLDVQRMLEVKGYRLTRISGSHHVFTKPGSRSVPIPVHNGKVKPAHVRLAQKLEP